MEKLKADLMLKQNELLIKLGFVHGKGSGKNDETGFIYTRTICLDYGKAFKVTVKLQKMELYISNIWRCDKELQEKIYEIPKEVLDSKNDFVDWLVEKIKKFKKDTEK